MLYQPLGLHRELVARANSGPFGCGGTTHPKIFDAALFKLAKTNA
jgi:hypothetical protein